MKYRCSGCQLRYSHLETLEKTIFTAALMWICYWQKPLPTACDISIVPPLDFVNFLLHMFFIIPVIYD